MHVVWFKRDLRIQDHQALADAAKQGPVLPLYIIEPALWQQADASHRHYQFLLQSLQELDQALTELGQGLVIKVGEAREVLAALHQQHNIQTLWSHQETGNGWTYQRDKQVNAWLQQQGIPWHEPLQHGVIRRLKNRDGWAKRWHENMQQPIIAAPKALSPVEETSDAIPTAKQLGLRPDGLLEQQAGGRIQASELLHSFLHQRGETYTKAMSSPVIAFDSCSRLSPHLAYGTLSMREVLQALQQRQQAVKALPAGTKGKWPGALRSFAGRLRWHCHFIQKLEDEPRIEFENMHRAYDGLRDLEIDDQRFKAWQQGKTGYPMVDACMRALIATGWVNFRMRAMLMSFASYHLWLHWREPALYLATLFTGYEPGIHYSQVQMQSGTTGINSIRIYNPIKQGIDHDPQGEFIKQWIPELANMPQEAIHTPWLMPKQMADYPMPIVDEKVARKYAADQLYQRRKTSSHQAAAEKIITKHASRKAPPKRKRVSKKTKNDKQKELPF